MHRFFPRVPVLLRCGLAAMFVACAGTMVLAQTAAPRPGAGENAKGRTVPPRPYPGDVMKHWPAYPDEARAAGQEGTVVVRLRITAAGNPENITVERSSSVVSLDVAAALAVSRWKFEPATRDGKPVDATVSLPIRFSLTDAPPAQGAAPQ
ncbi:TonB family protein [Pseudochelatococcus lubricantis]|uniref:TonB family protein n=1 Tax=Pseudochelatococcus lubricantis TaxID=1538102 RepID=A0ABX0UTV6_9HYPH|nr:energy transducer TonB [Pseudochelatococcus lubricantis]NIJ56403.1 TonB family protein [Pseudochelatococcus lubricantis]